MPAARKTARHLFLPQLIEPVAGTWSVEEVDLQKAEVDTHNRIARVPQAYTPAQRLARLHEAGHIKYSPSPHQPHGDWPDSLVRIVNCVIDAGVEPDLNAIDRLSKMLEENRVDWLLWTRHGIDTRPAREVLNWALMPDPSNLLDALTWCMQLAWTVWASRGLGLKVDGMPPSRPPDPDTGDYFDKAWAYVVDSRPDLGQAMIKACLRIFETPTDETRENMAVELAKFFPAVKPPEPPPPPPKPEEEEARKEEEKKEAEAEVEVEKAETGVHADLESHGTYELHDHAAKVRRPSMRIARRAVPVAQGTEVRYAHRYFQDGAIFKRRLLTEAGIMIDGSSSMRWTNEDMIKVVDRLPAVKVGLYSGNDHATEGIVGRICILARDGKFSKFTGKDPDMKGGNAVDYEALQLLARWPKPRLWLSDGIVCGGVHSGKPSEKYDFDAGYYHRWGKLHDLCNALMKRAEILRVPDNETMHKLLARQRVTLYRSTRPGRTEQRGQPREDRQWPPNCLPEPISFQL